MTRITLRSRVLIAVTCCLSLNGCGALPHDTSVKLRGTGPASHLVPTGDATDAGAAVSPGALLDLWRGFDNDLGLAPRAQIQFSGTMLAWDPAASGTAIARMTGEVAELRRVWAEYYETKFHDIHDAQQRVDNLNGHVRQLRREVQSLPGTREIQLAAAATWWDTRLAFLERSGVVEPGGGADHARTVFQRYCDAKLWEFATAPQMIATTFERRPAPFGPCESWYVARGYFEGHHCQVSRDQASIAAGAWFDCFWHDGVLKTYAFHSRYSNEKSARIHQYLGKGLLRSALTSPDRSGDARASVLGMKKARKKTFSRFDGDPDEESLRELFVPDRSPGRSGLETATPRAVVDHVEENPRSQSSLNPSLAFFPRAVTSDPAFVAEREAHAAFASLGRRDFVNFNSASDFMWNGSSMTLPWSEMIDVAESHPWLEMILGLMPGDFSAAMRASRHQLEEAKSLLSQLRDRQSVVDREFSEQAVRTMAASVQPGIAQAFWPEVVLRMTANGGGRRSATGAPMELALALSRDREPLQGPLLESSAACGNSDSLCAWLDARSGALRVKLTPAQLDAQGLGVRVPAPVDIDARTRGFNELPPELDAGTSLEMVLYLGRIGRTPVISGRTILRRELPDGLAFEVEGEVSFLRL
ncbi:hypothetical protein EBZ80_00515 [bacterium]|nr:hypothetical protein [bacterium]